MKEMLRKNKVTIVFFQETKLRAFSQGSAGGNAIFWDSSEVEVIETEEGQYSLAVHFRSLKDNKHWVALSVYGPTTYSQRQDFRYELSAIIQLWSLPWIVGGDFNVIRYCSEKSGGRNCLTPSMLQFNELVDELSLIEPALTGAQFTWSNGRSRPILAKLDRFFVSHEWLDMHKDIIGKVLTRSTSDHRPILIETDPESWGPPPFRFEEGWLLEENFKDKMKVWWQECEIRGTTCYVFSQKLKQIKHKMKAWAAERKINLEGEKEALIRRIHDYDITEEEFGNLTTLEGIERDVLKKLMKIEWLEREFIGNKEHSTSGSRKEKLCAFVRKGQEKGWITGMGIRDIRIPILQFADETLLLCDGIDEGLLHSKALLSLYEMMSGQNINWEKSGLFGVNAHAVAQNLAASILHCNRIQLPSSYLGLPLFQTKNNKALWNPIVEKYQRRLEGWKRQLLSQAGRATLIRATLAGIPNYWLSLIPCPANVEHKFLWCGTEQKVKYPLVRWKRVCRPKELGGMGLKRIKHMNEVMLSKWCWRFATEKEALWRHVIEKKYGKNSPDWLPRDRVVTSPIWKVVLKCMKKCYPILDIM
ncbi:hypothetical protein H6P81_020791 [Aristolochia fimbriata]|uniref:Endonuclease/exonuclease/phosphatase domain-containing protein n=1 Tax=Aristolochia fimbriata TaxID=158543 RepID=A0AAV7DYC6_ARIFI|nr:hypothetical protein H6P81_020791 [Aristolochia fimbriata]